MMHPEVSEGPGLGVPGHPEEGAPHGGLGAAVPAVGLGRSRQSLLNRNDGCEGGALRRREV